MDDASPWPDILLWKDRPGARSRPDVQVWRVDRPRRARVVVLYTHALLGEGLACLLESEAFVDAVAVASNDVRARAAALHERPELVIVEETDPVRSFEGAGSLPVVFVRLDGDGCSNGARLADPDAIVALARGLRQPVHADINAR